MEDNPYSALVKTIRDDSAENRPASYRLGTVVSASPFIIEVCGNELGAGSFLINESLARHSETNDLENVLKAGDRVVMLAQEDSQLFIVLCKVVEP